MLTRTMASWGGNAEGLPRREPSSISIRAVSQAIRERRTEGPQPQEERVVTVLRKGTEVVASKDSGFANDAVDIRAVARVGFGFLHDLEAPPRDNARASPP